MAIIDLTYTTQNLQAVSFTPEKESRSRECSNQANLRGCQWESLPPLTLSNLTRGV